jgi:preprotein translocase subunit SecY
MSILLFPSMIGGFIGERGGKYAGLIKSISNFFNPQINPLGYGFFYFILVVLFTYFYTAVTFDPKTVSNNLKKVGGFIPGIRPGESTASYISFILNRVELLGAIFLGFIAVIPSIISSFTGIHGFTFFIGGTSVLIIVSVILETYRALKAQLEMREYDRI